MLFFGLKIRGADSYQDQLSWIANLNERYTRSKLEAREELRMPVLQKPSQFRRAYVAALDLELSKNTRANPKEDRRLYNVDRRSRS